MRISYLGIGKILKKFIEDYNFLTFSYWDEEKQKWVDFTLV